MDKFGIDSQKVVYHPERVAQWAAADDWEKAKKVYPLYVEISPAGACNHRCTFCAVDYIGYVTKFLDTKILKERLSEMGRKGVRSVMFAGEGEPLLHKDIAELTTHAKASGIDVSFTTNAVALTPKFIENALSCVTWIKASINAGSAKTYAAVHQTKEADFERALGNMKAAVDFKRANKLGTALGAQMVLLPENVSEAEPLAKRCRDIGLDYLVVKPYSQHKMSKTRQYEGMRYDALMSLGDRLDKISGGGFSVVFRRHTMEKWDDAERHYTTCHATPYFWAYVMASGDVYGCSAYLLDERFNYGNLQEKSFTQIWEGERRKKNWKYVLTELDISECRKNCRMDEVNRYLWKVKNPPEHVNFI
ncbi:MAG: radical SAM protein [Elusimicrobia bacterium]|nr:radical SAM protein [Elusimicrobiota bacterium]